MSPLSGRRFSFLPRTFTLTAARPLCALALVAALGSLSAACDGGETDTGATSGTSSTSESICADDPRAMAYTVGIEEAAADGSVKVRFVDADPAPPSKGNNTFMIQLLDAGGAPIEGATVTTKPFMPDHGHGSSIVPQTTPMGAEGKYSVTPVTLFMPGIWDVTFTIEPAGAASQKVVFTFCVDG